MALFPLAGSVLASADSQTFQLTVLGRFPGGSGAISPVSWLTYVAAGWEADPVADPVA